MAEILVTGATGFVGRHVVAELLKRGKRVIALSRSKDRLREMDWYEQVRPLYGDVCNPSALDPALLAYAGSLIHLAWDGLPNYQSLHHLEEQLPAQMLFLRRVVESGVKQVFVSGTCHEYGLQNGPLGPETETRPVTSYAIAKDALHRYLRQLARQQPFRLLWGRLFYMHGPGQNARSLLALLQSAIERGDLAFDMSPGEQLRDYQSVEDSAVQIVDALTAVTTTRTIDSGGVLNICRGVPISVRRLVEETVRNQGSSIEIRLGKLAYLDYEPLAYWGLRQFQEMP